jgi:hypothetical protein
VLVAAGLVLVGCLAAYFYWMWHEPDAGPAVRSFDGDSGRLRRTVIVPTLDTPIPEGKSAVWCASFQLAWNRLKADVAKGPVGVANAEEVARRLNEEGFHPPKRAGRFTGGMVWGMLTRQGAGASRSRAEGVAAHLEKGEWVLGELARYLGMPPATLHRWRKAGWVRARKLAVSGGLWAIVATGPERRRMEKLRRFQKAKPNQPIPSDLTTPQIPGRK